MLLNRSVYRANLTRGSLPIGSAGASSVGSPRLSRQSSQHSLHSVSQNLQTLQNQAGLPSADYADIQTLSRQGSHSSLVSVRVCVCVCVCVWSQDIYGHTIYYIRQ